MSDRHDELYKKYMAFNGVMLEDYQPIEIAAVMIAQGLSFYRTFMTESDYQKMVDAIYNSKDKVRTIERGL